MEMELDKIRLIEARKVPDLVVRGYGEADLHKLVRAFNEVFSKTPDPFPHITEKDLKDLPTDRILVAEIRGEIAGFLMCGIKRIEEEEVGIVGYVGVLEKYRRRGIATHLAIAAGEYFLKNRLKKVICEVYYLNKTSYKFMEEFGFKQAATIYVPAEETMRSLYRVKARDSSNSTSERN
jgi:N-acetylglutamate synthase-like GNAT family acetyltransferase